jgi:glutamate-1-semialdehyde 2,1-aminomutase
VLHDERIICEPDSREPWFICAAHDDSCMSDTLRAFEVAVDATLEKLAAERGGKPAAAAGAPGRA